MQVDGAKEWMVTIARLYENIFGYFAYAHLTVTKAMAKDLNSIGKKIVLYDRPPNHFKIFDDKQKADFLTRLEFSKVELSKHDHVLSENKFIQFREMEAVLRKDRPFLIICGTSWTRDEDFSILIDALKECDSKVKRPICIVITGKGPMKEYYVNLYLNMNLKNIFLHTAWLSVEDYPKMIACADIGICLHTSSSGLDLPMKVVDMFGSGVPVLALNFKCVGELVQDGMNGYIFSTKEQLAKLLIQVQNQNLNSLRSGVLEWRSKGDWESNWDQIVGPLINL